MTVGHGRLSGRKVWITGASSGIGRALALKLSAAGNHVAASARTAKALDDLVVEAAKTGGSIRAYPLDITDRQAVRDVAAAVLRDYDGIDLAVLNAGTHHPVKAPDFKAADLDALIRINLIGTGHCLEPLLDHMIPRRTGHIALVASVAGYRGLPTAIYYGASKAALINLAESLKLDLDHQGVKIQLINPGFVETPLTSKNDFAMPFLIDAETAATRIVAGLESSAFEITFPKRFAYLLKLLRMLPYRLYFPLVARMTNQ